MMEQVDDSGELVERVAALDIGKASVMACTRIPHEDGRRRLQEVREYGTTTGALLGLAGQLRDRGGHPGGDGGDQRLLEAGVLPAGGRGVHVLAAERPAREERARPPEDRL
jgi:hypothetical protein